MINGLINCKFDQLSVSEAYVGEGGPVMHDRIFLVHCVKLLNYCTLERNSTGQVTFYKLPEIHGYVYLVGFCQIRN